MVKNAAAPLVLFVLLLLLKQLPVNLSKPTRCTQTSQFYRNPGSDDCSKYYLCLDGEVYEFQCSNGLMFDVDRQICDFKSAVQNCASAVAANQGQEQWRCADGMTVAARYFCDGSEDCGDGSDEVGCEGRADPFEVGRCEEGRCLLPECFCSKDGKQIPWNLSANNTPQMVLLTFENEINYKNWQVLQEIFAKNRKNPNACPISATFFVSHNNTNYQLIQKLWSDGHEIAVNSITKRTPETWWSHNATLEDWFDEMIGEANILHRFANVGAAQIRGMRAPFLKIGGNRQFLMAKEFGLAYDSSITAPLANGIPLWPYTLDYKAACSDAQNCPTRSYQGVWEMVLNELQGLGYVLNASTTQQKTKEETLRLLTQNFERHYVTNRAPFGLHIDLSWLETKDNRAALQLFIEGAAQRRDVWFVSNSEAIDWIKTREFKCQQKQLQAEAVCSVANVCRVEGVEEGFYTCSECPKKYPWFRNEFGNVY